MFRRIELINESRDPETGELEIYKNGLMGISREGVDDAWIDALRGPGRSIPRNARFYFTDKGWREVGRQVVEACQRAGQQYRVVRVKENEVHVVWRDRHTDYEVAAQPKKRR